MTIQTKLMTTIDTTFLTDDGIIPRGQKKHHSKSNLGHETRINRPDIVASHIHRISALPPEAGIWLLRLSTMRRPKDTDLLLPSLQHLARCRREESVDGLSILKYLSLHPP